MYRFYQETKFSLNLPGCNLLICRSQLLLNEFLISFYLLIFTFYTQVFYLLTQVKICQYNKKQWLHWQQNKVPLPKVS